MFVRTILRDLDSIDVWAARLKKKRKGEEQFFQFFLSKQRRQILFCLAEELGLARSAAVEAYSKKHPESIVNSPRVELAYQATLAWAEYRGYEISKEAVA